MESCKHCLHFEICQNVAQVAGQPDDWHIKFDNCKSYKDSRKYRFIPCNIGDEVWFVRKYKGHPHIKRAFVSEMYFIKGMRLCIVGKSCGRGEWMKEVFPTYEAAEAALEGRAHG